MYSILTRNGGRCPDRAKGQGYTSNDPGWTCVCEDHCKWDKCYLKDPPESCLVGAGGIWRWDPRKNYWVATVYKGKNSNYIFKQKRI